MAELPTTQRAYTLRLRRAPGKCSTCGNDDCNCWRDVLWATHEAVNKGAQGFGEWLLTLRGGLDHNLTAEPDPTSDDIDKEWKVLRKNAKVNNQAEPSREEAQQSAAQKRKDRIRDKRILLALSWLSVEDEGGAPKEDGIIIAYGDKCKHFRNNQDSRDRKIEEALRGILSKRGLTTDEIESWVHDCEGSLKVRIRDDAVWVNRSAAFDATAQQCPSLTRDDIWDFLEPFFVNVESYLRSTRTASEEDSTSDAGNKEDNAKDLVQKAGGWLSKRMGTGGGADFESMSHAYDAIVGWTEGVTVGKPGGETLAALTCHLKQEGFSPSAEDVKGVLSVISGPGYKSATRNHVIAVNDRSAVTHDDLTKLAELAKADAQTSKSKIGGKGSRPYATMILQQAESACGFTYRTDENGKDVSVVDYAQYSDDYKWGTARHTEFSVMLDHAARRVNVAHSGVKNAEAERRQFESDAKRLANVPPNALHWLRTYCEERGGTAGSLDGYRIRMRALDGWDKVIARWSRADCQTADDRIAAARQLQDDPEIDKFGDIQLFETLAAEEALCVWKSDGNPTAQPLKDFVAATEAEAKKRRFKVPAYRHPDPLRHPVFTDFGNSRWSIDFSVHRAPAKLGDLKQKVEKLAAALTEAEQKLSSATAMQRDARQQKVAECRDKLQRAERDFEAIRDQQRLELKVWNGQAVKPIPFRWSCKRLPADLALRSTKAAIGERRAGVSRADRLGRAAVGADGSTEVTIRGLFEQDHWNGRLQAPRSQLDAIARHVDKNGWDAKARRLVERIRWLVSFSAELAQLGPWKEYCDQFADDAPAKPFISRNGEYAVKHRDNDQRKGHAKLILSRLPGLRVLAVDLGHRYAAACAVWEALASERMATEIHGRTIVAGGSGPDDLYCHTRHADSRGKERITIYRRIGSDVLPDNTVHPAPWARLDRQFLIKLQGEDRPARKTSPAEIETVEQFEKWAGRNPFPDDSSRELAVDALMSDTVRTARLALARHGRRAKIAYQLTATARTLPGGRSQEMDEAGRLELLLDTLADWHALATDSRWSDESTRQLWNSRLAVLAGGFTIEPPQQPAQTEQQPFKAERRKAEQALREKLQPLAQMLAGNETLRRELHQAWCARWSADDDQWKQKLKWLARWLMPRQLSRMIEITKKDGRRIKRREPIRQAIAAASNVGGLSLTRISTLTEFRRKVQVGYFTRMRPDGSRAEIGPGFGQSTLNTLERMKDQRIKQLASRIVEAALGIGSEQDPIYDVAKRKVRHPQRPRQRSNDPRFAPCHAVIIEDLSHYRPEETRTRRENRATMDWKSAETRKRLADHCQLYGLHLRDVNPQYTSRQDSRTGAPGIRCVDVSIADFVTRPWWRKQVARARKKTQEKKGDSCERYLIALDDIWSDASDDVKTSAPPLRIPLSSGDIFVSADPQSPLAGGIQADLNAAANIGLRALMDPDFPGRWWYVPCDPKTKQAHADKVKGGILDNIGALQEIDAEPAAKTRTRRVRAPRQIVNLWRDSAAATIRGTADGELWTETSAYWNSTTARVVYVLRKQANLPSE